MGRECLILIICSIQISEWDCKRCNENHFLGSVLWCTWNTHHGLCGFSLAARWDVYIEKYILLQDSLLKSDRYLWNQKIFMWIMLAEANQIYCISNYMYEHFLMLCLLSFRFVEKCVPLIRHYFIIPYKGHNRTQFFYS